MSEQYLHVLKACLIETGKNSLRHLEGNIDVGSKASHKELVTFVDRQNEQMIIQRIKENFPHHKIMGKKVIQEKRLNRMISFGLLIRSMGQRTIYIKNKLLRSPSLYIRMDKGFAGLFTTLLLMNFFGQRKVQAHI